MTVRGRHIHLLSCARMFFDEHRAQEQADTLGITAARIMTPTAIIFIVAPRAGFKDVWMDKSDGYYLLRGDLKDAS